MASPKVFDTNFYGLREARALLLGDHPYRDFYEWGIPTPVAGFGGMQRLIGNRLIGDYLLQWSLIVAGSLLAVSLGYGLSRSLWASLSMAALSRSVMTTASMPASML
jgi:hypothetical protein